MNQETEARYFVAGEGVSKLTGNKVESESLNMKRCIWIPKEIFTLILAFSFIFIIKIYLLLY